MGRVAFNVAPRLARFEPTTVDRNAAIAPWSNLLAILQRAQEERSAVRGVRLEAGAQQQVRAEEATVWFEAVGRRATGHRAAAAPLVQLPWVDDLQA